MAFSGSKLALPKGAETIAYRALEDVLRTDPTLNRVVKTWASWRGDPSDLLQPCPALCPFIQVSPRPAGASWAAEGLHKEPLYIAVFVAVAGLDVDELLNLWAAIRGAVFPQDQARHEVVAEKLMVDAKVVKATIITPALEPASDKKDAPPNMLFARGLVELLLHVPT